MADLLNKVKGNHGNFHEITPESSHWKYIEFSLYRLITEDRYNEFSQHQEVMKPVRSCPYHGKQHAASHPSIAFNTSKGKGGDSGCINYVACKKVILPKVCRMLRILCPQAEDFMPSGTGHPTQGITMTSIISLIGLTWNSCVSR
jgi:hypothetical protein